MSFCSLIKGITPNIRVLCFVPINSFLLNLLYVFWNASGHFVLDFFPANLRVDRPSCVSEHGAGLCGDRLSCVSDRVADLCVDRLSCVSDAELVSVLIGSLVF